MLALTAVPAFAVAADADAKRTLKKFYDWYLALPQHNWMQHLSQVETLFDPVLYARLQTVLDREATSHEEILDFDPFAAAQWDLSAYSLGDPVRSGIDVRVPMTLRLDGNNGFNTHAVAVLRQSKSGAFVIYNFEYANPTFNLRDTLQEAIEKG